MFATLVSLLWKTVERTQGIHKRELMAERLKPGTAGSTVGSRPVQGDEIFVFDFCKW
jgi:hypothetical protein